MPATPDLATLIAPTVLERAGYHQGSFAHARPFRHCVIEPFFAAPFASALSAAFPAFEQGNARNEAGHLGGKSVVEQIRGLGESYRQLDQLMQSPELLVLIGRITGIDDLLYDPWYFGGGTHENRHGQGLDSHIDFNLHPNTGWHRRLNLIIYLNPHWPDEWGGLLRLSADSLQDNPEHLRNDDVVEIAPVFNRAVLFETTEHSWHGFDTIVLPEDRRGVSRKSIALYFYTAQRPATETAARHSTIYVDEALPEHLRAGATLAAADIEQLRILMARRDRHTRRLYDEISRLQARLDLSASGQLADLVRRVRARLRR